MPNTATASAVTDSIPSAEELLERARALAPAIRERARQTALNGDVPPESVAAIRDAGHGTIRRLRRRRIGRALRAGVRPRPIRWPRAAGAAGKQQARYGEQACNGERATRAPAWLVV